MSSRREFVSKTSKSLLGLSLTSLGASAKLPVKTDSIKSARIIPSMKGDIDTQKFGTTLIHEHILFGNIPGEKRIESIDFATKMIKDAERVGISTLVDLSPSRDIQLYQSIAEMVSANIVVSTGSYIRRMMPDYIASMTEDRFTNHIRKEITEGIQGTKIRAAIIKVAAEKTPMTDYEKMIFTAAAKVQREVNVPIATHAIYEPGDQFDLLVKHGANPNKLFFSHTEAVFGWGGLSREEIGKELLRIAKGGGSMLFNNFGYSFDTPWEDLVYLIRLLCDKGFANKVLISCDTYWQWKNGAIVVNVDDKHPETRKKTYAYMMTDAVPDLLKAGFSADNIKTFLVDNPARFFS